MSKKNELLHGFCQKIELFSIRAFKQIPTEKTVFEYSWYKWTLFRTEKLSLKNVQEVKIYNRLFYHVCFFGKPRTKDWF